MGKYLVKIGFDHGGPEDGPILHTTIDMIEASSEKDAENQINNKYGYGRDDSYCGCSAKLATEDEIFQWECEMTEAKEEYKALVDAGIIDPEEDEAMWKEYEEDEKRRDYLLKLADTLDNPSVIKWSINRDDEILIDTRNMSDNQILDYMRKYVA